MSRVEANNETLLGSSSTIVFAWTSEKLHRNTAHSNSASHIASSRKKISTPINKKVIKTFSFHLLTSMTKNRSDKNFLMETILELLLRRDSERF